ncbi:acyl-CoA thioesterase [Pigmentibacter ruber]|uniref:acyl-CoA thioesterase n=1 Tax=Pigmentibacter ruber TaxID=2683196 RepID=UPI00131DB4D4|nr:thioesterase family protein [Pigmentibacter ruber]BFD32218.1 hypothetical protein GTC16762_18360 [Pigmentibacter ruber]
MSNIKNIQKFYYELTIKEHHLDTFGHVNNAVYLELFEEARWEFISENGYGLKKIQNEKKGPIILDTSIKFLKELKLREKIIIETFCTEVSKKIIKIKHFIRNSENTICTEADFTMAFFDLERRKIIEQPKEWLQALGIHFIDEMSN